LPAFKRDKYGRIEATIENAVKAVACVDFCAMNIRFDSFRDEIMYAAAGDDVFATFSDADYSRLRIRLESKGFKPVGRELIRDAVGLVADNNPFDSAIAWLNALPWDGHPRVENFLRDCFGASDTDYVRAVSLYLWTALAGRVLSPGVKADMVPILVGDQGAVKSSSVAAMVPGVEFFTEISFSEKDEDLARKMRGRLIAEIAELRGLHTRELDSIKAFIARTHETWVPKYREFAVQFPRRLVFIGTTNQDEFLADETGNRRWLPVPGAGCRCAPARPTSKPCGGIACSSGPKRASCLVCSAWPIRRPSAWRLRCMLTIRSAIRGTKRLLRGWTHPICSLARFRERVNSYALAKCCAVRSGLTTDRLQSAKKCELAFRCERAVYCAFIGGSTAWVQGFGCTAQPPATTSWR